jgi:hypothetical protein
MAIPEKIAKIIKENKRHINDIRAISKYIPKHPERLKGLPVYKPHEIDVLKELVQAYLDTEASPFLEFMPAFINCVELYRWLDNEQDFSDQTIICELLLEDLENMPLYLSDRISDKIKIFAHWRLKLKK